MPDFKFMKKMTATPKINTKIFYLKLPKVNETVLLETARRFNLKGDKKSGRFSSDPSKMTYTEGPFAVTLYRSSGGVRYYDRTRWQVDDGKSRVDFPDDKAITTAKSFLKKANIIPVEECQLLKTTHLHVGSVQRDTTKAEERIIDVGVVFQRMIYKVPVEGPGGKVVVYLDHKGEVTGCDCTWRNIEKVHKEVPFQQLRSPGYGEEDLRKYWGKLNISNIEVTETRFGYFEYGKDELQRYLQPSYIMPIVVIGTDERIKMKTFHVTLAAPQPVGKIMPTYKKFVEEAPRKE